MPPGYLGLTWPSLLSARQYGVMRLAALPGHLVGGMGGDPREDTGGDRAGEVGLVFFGQRSTQIVDGGESAPGHFFHQCIDLDRRRNVKAAFAEFLGEFAVTTIAVLAQILGVTELSCPVDADFLYRHDGKIVSEKPGKAIQTP